ncbi:MAG TPA: preprotein translocase subunit SecG [Burkholderiaceae bacterium]|nr:preprotein translocase subunit SecG [Burkholderiaceae bacterium]
MELFASVLLAVQVLASLSIIVLVLLQQGKGADMGAAFGGGSAGSLFGAAGAANFLSRMTKWAAIVFFACTIGLAWVAHHPTGSPLEGGVMQGFEASDVPGAAQVPGTTEVPGAAVPGAVPSVPGPAADVPADVPSVAPAAGAADTGAAE